MKAPRITSLSALSSATISRNLSNGTWITSPRITDDRGQIEALAREQTQLADEAVRPVDGYHPVFLAKALDDRHGARLDDEEVAAHVARGKQDLARLDLANATQLAQSRPLVFVEPGKRAVAIGGLCDPRSDFAVHC